MLLPPRCATANERPLSFSLDIAIGENGGVTNVDGIDTLESWYDPNAEYFRVRTPEGKRYILRFDGRDGQWTLQSGFDGGELLARPGIQFVSVEPNHSYSRIKNRRI